MSVVRHAEEETTAGPVNVIILHLLMGVNNVKDHSGKENDYVTITSAQVTDYVLDCSYNS